MKMKIKKITHNHILSWIYALVVAVPLVTILVRCCYITFNKNAYQSYSDSYVTRENSFTGLSIIQENYEYSLNIATFIEESEGLTQSSPTLIYKNDIDWSYYQNIPQSVLDQVDRFFILRANNSYVNIFLLDNNNTELTIINKSVSTWLSYDNLIIYFTSGGYDSNRFNTIYGDYLIQYIYSYNNLDNAFEYSLNELTKNGNTGNLNLVNWFGDLFLDMDNAKTQLYLSFINYYMNYVLMVSCVYLLFSVLMWFLTWARRLLSKGLGD